MQWEQLEPEADTEIEPLHDEFRRAAAKATAAAPPPYTIEAPLGLSNEHVLHIGTDARGRRVVIKRMLPAAANRAAYRARFLVEAELGTYLDHPNLVRVFELGEHEGLPFLTRELVEGVNLRTLVALAGRQGLSVPLVLALGSQVASALGYVHSRIGVRGEPLHLVHGELSPAAILVTARGHAKLTEAGVGRLGGKPLRPSNGGRRGCFGYRAPEQLLGKTVGPRTDLFALGVVLAEVVSGVPLVADEAPYLEDFEAVVRARCRTRLDLPRAFVDLLVDLTALAPERRPENADAVVQRLARILAGYGPPPRLEAELAPIFGRIVTADGPAELAPAQAAPEPEPEALGAASKPDAPDPEAFIGYPAAPLFPFAASPIPGWAWPAAEPGESGAELEAPPSSASWDISFATPAEHPANAVAEIAEDGSAAPPPREEEGSIPLPPLDPPLPQTPEPPPPAPEAEHPAVRLPPRPVSGTGAVAASPGELPYVRSAERRAAHRRHSRGAYGPASETEPGAPEAAAPEPEPPAAQATLQPAPAERAFFPGLEEDSIHRDLEAIRGRRLPPRLVLTLVALSVALGWLAARLQACAA